MTLSLQKAFCASKQLKNSRVERFGVTDFQRHVFLAPSIERNSSLFRQAKINLGTDP